jgi:hypothetical protein
MERLKLMETEKPTSNMFPSHTKHIRKISITKPSFTPSRMEMHVEVRTEEGYSDLTSMLYIAICDSRNETHPRTYITAFSVQRFDDEIVDWLANVLSYQLMSLFTATERNLRRDVHNKINELRTLLLI